MIHYSTCPVCKSGYINTSFAATDFTVSKEQFIICECVTCTLRFTQDVPEQASIGQYYQSNQYISHSDSKKGVIHKLYHRVRGITLTLKRKLVEKNASVSKGNLLDIGSGTGAFLNAMKLAGWTVTGLEPDETAREKSFELHGIAPSLPAQLFSMKPHSYDVVSMWHVLEHVHELHAYIEQIKTILKQSGILLIAVPNYTSFDATFYKEQWAAYDVPRHLYHFSPKSMRRLLQQHGLVIKAIQPMWFDSFYVSLLSEQYQQGSMIRAFLVGFFSNVKALFKWNQCSSLIYIVTKG